MVAPSLQTSFSSASSASMAGPSRRAPRQPLSPAAMASVQVVVRVRPLNDREKKHGTLPVISASTSDKTVTVIKGTGSRQIKSSYKFDNVFTSFSTQEDVFEATLQPIIRDVLNGYESTVFAYGQTGTGKTHTMEGDLSDVQQHGVIPRSAAAIFDALKRDPDYLSSTVYCSLLEIYNEELSDLLVDKSSKRANAQSRGTATNQKLAIMEGENGPFCRGLSESKVTNAEDLLALMQKAHQQRMTGETDMNKESSRSHCIFTLRVLAKRKLVDGSILEVGGKLHCVDLAGSECAKSCGNAGKQQAARERERMNINRSLLTLGRVVKLLKERSEKPSAASSVRIPYRDSKLTRILQESLGGRCKTCLIATISPSVTAIEESMSTLNYAQAANGIINKPITTSLMSVGGFDNKSPRGEGASGTGTSVEHWHEMECRLEYMQSQVDEAQQALARKHIQHQEFVERAEKAEMAQELAERKFEKATHDISVLESKVEDVTHQLEESEKALRETKVILGATQRTEVALTEEAVRLLAVLQTTITDGDSMHRALLEKRKEDVDRKTATKDFQTTQLRSLQELLQNLQCIGEIQKKKRSELESTNCDHKEMQLQLLDHHSDVVRGIQKDCLSDIASLKSSIEGGVLPVFRTLTLSLREKLDFLCVSLEKGEENLRSHCQLTLNRLADNSNQIAEMQRSYNASSKDVMENMSTHLEETRQHLFETIQEVTTALQKANGDRQLHCKGMIKSLADFKDRCTGSIDHMVSLSNAHVDSVNRSIQTMKDEKENRSSILQAFSDLDNFIRKEKDEHIQKLERQLELLTKQHEALIDSNSKHQQMNKELVSNVMNGVQSLLAKEIESLNEFQSRNFTALMERNEELNSSNKNITKLTSDTFGQLESNNSQSRYSCRQNFEGQDQLARTLQTEISDFDAQLESATRTIRNPIESFADECETALVVFGTEDAKNTESIIGTVKRSVEEATNELASVSQDKLPNMVSQLQKLNSEGYEYVKKQVLEPCRIQVVGEIQSNQTEVYTSARSDVSLLKTKMEEGVNDVVEEVKKGLRFASGVERHLEVGFNETFAGSIDEHTNLIRESRWLENSLEAHAKHMANQVATSSAVVSSSVDCLGAFARDVILVEEETPDIAERSIPTFSRHLTSTDKPDVILKEAGLFIEVDSSVGANENVPETEISESKLPVPSPAPIVLRDRTGSINAPGAVDVSPPLKRAADKTKSNQTNGTRKRYKSRLR